MTNRRRLAISTLTIFAGGAIIWFLGWFLWCQFEGWAFIKNTTFQHLLLLLISAWIVGALVKARPRSSPSEKAATSTTREVQRQPENNPHPVLRSNPDLKALSAKVAEILEKQTDVQAIMRFFKTREQKDSLRRPIQKSEIKIEIPEEVAEQLKPQKMRPRKPEIREVD
jgi:hypothetical protein